jgi:crossover junction endodeoxyribonuclease RusA
MTMLQIQLPYPSRDLSQNARVHWAKRGKATDEARALAKVTTLNALRSMSSQGSALLTTAKTFRVQIAIFWPELKRKRDALNTAAMLKPHIDGISDALGVDDSRFTEWIVKIGGPLGDGQVVLIVDPLEI